MRKPTLKHSITFTEVIHFCYQVIEGHGFAVLIPACLAILFTIAFFFGDDH